MASQRPPQLVSVEGGIGAGKSTLLRALQAGLGAAAGYLPEPVEAWSPYLDAFYAAPAAHAFELQMEVLRTRAQQVHEAVHVAAAGGAHVPVPAASGGWGRLVIMERSVGSTLHVFGRVLARRYPDAAWGVYERWGATLEQSWLPAPDAVVYLDAPSDVCMRRISERGRGVEPDGITLAYLDELRAAHEAWLRERPPPRLLRLDAALSPDDQAARVVEFLAA